MKQAKHRRYDSNHKIQNQAKLISSGCVRGVVTFGDEGIQGVLWAGGCLYLDLGAGDMGVRSVAFHWAAYL